MKKSIWDNKICTFYLVVQTLLYLTFLGLDLTNGSSALSSKIKFIIILLCFFYVLCFTKSPGKGCFLDKFVWNLQNEYAWSVFFKCALFFTVISDLCLLILNVNFLGVLTFIIVQQLYGLCLDITGKKEKSKRNHHYFLRRLGIQIILSIGFILILQRIEINTNYLLCITVFYFISIVTNVFRAIKQAFRRNNNQIENNSRILFALGMILFLLCDINVGLFNLSDFLSLSKQQYDLMYQISSILMWVFYAPSQVLISLSGRKS